MRRGWRSVVSSIVGEVCNVYRPLCFNMCEQSKFPSSRWLNFLNIHRYVGTFVFSFFKMPKWSSNISILPRYHFGFSPTVVCAYGAGDGHDGHLEYLREPGNAGWGNILAKRLTWKSHEFETVFSSLPRYLDDTSACNQRFWMFSEKERFCFSKYIHQFNHIRQYKSVSSALSHHTFLVEGDSCPSFARFFSCYGCCIGRQFPTFFLHRVSGPKTQNWTCQVSETLWEATLCQFGSLTLEIEISKERNLRILSINAGRLLYWNPYNGLS